MLMHPKPVSLPPFFLPLSGDGLCFSTTHNCTGASSNLELQEECCLGNGLSYGNGSECQICYGKHNYVKYGVSHILYYHVKPHTYHISYYHDLCVDIFCNSIHSSSLVSKRRHCHTMKYILAPPHGYIIQEVILTSWSCVASVPGSLPYAYAIFTYDLWTPRNEKSGLGTRLGHVYSPRGVHAYAYTINAICML